MHVSTYENRSSDIDNIGFLCEYFSNIINNLLGLIAKDLNLSFSEDLAFRQLLNELIKVVYLACA